MFAHSKKKFESDSNQTTQIIYTQPLWQNSAGVCFFLYKQKGILPLKPMDNFGTSMSRFIKSQNNNCEVQIKELSSECVMQYEILHSHSTSELCGNGDLWNCNYINMNTWETSHANGENYRNSHCTMPISSRFMCLRIRELSRFVCHGQKKSFFKVWIYIIIKCWQTLISEGERSKCFPFYKGICFAFSQKSWMYLAI